MAEVVRKLSWNIYNNLPLQTWVLIPRNQFFIAFMVCEGKIKEISDDCSAKISCNEGSSWNN